MKQALNPKMPEMGSTFVSDKELSLEDITYHLSKTQNGVMLASKKKKFLLNILTNKAELLEQCKVFDSFVTDSHLENAVRLSIPENTRVINRDSKNVDLAAMVSRLLPPLNMLQTYLKSQYKLEANRKHNLRTSTQDQHKPSPIKFLLEEAVEVYDKVEALCYEKRSKPTIYSVTKPIKLTPVQRERRWSAERVPIAKQLQKCVSCDHQSTNLPLENDQIEEFNKQQAENYARNSVLWDAYQKKLANGDTTARKPTGVSRRPQKRNFKEPILMCMCSTSYCLGDFDTARNSCPIKCLHTTVCTNKDGSEEEITQRYSFDGVPKSCTCPICKCKCRFACKISEVPSILLQKSIEKQTKVPEVVEDPFNNGTASMQPLLNDIMKNAMKVCYKTAENERKNQILKQKRFDPIESEYIENRGVSAGCQHAAVNIVTASPNISLADRKKWRKGLGKPSTMAILPSGDAFDTRTIGVSNKHATNNRLGINTNNDVKFSPGMKSNIKIDYGQQCAQYQSFITNDNNDKMPHESITINDSDDQDTTTNDEEVIVFDVIKKKPTARTIGTSSLKTEEDKLTVKKNNLLLSMYKQIMVCARTILTRSIKKVMDYSKANCTKSTESVNVLRIKIRKLKQMIQILESSNNDNNTHLNDIRSVTNDGLDLEDSISVSANEILDRLMILHDIE